MKIAMLNCLKANRCCTGAACFRAFYQKTRAFEIYRDQDVELAAFARCNGCDALPGEDPGLDEKLERFVKEGVEAVHLGVCTVSRDGKECPVITKIANQLESDGIRVIRGTH